MKNLPLLFAVVLIFICFTLLENAYAEKIEHISISEAKGKSDLAQIFSLENNLFVVWRDNTPGNDDVFFAKSLNGGLSFDTPLNLSNNTGGSAFPRMSVVGKNIYATWYDYTPIQSDIFFAKSIDEGNSFETINLSNNRGASYNPWIASYDSNVFVVWNDETPQLAILNITKPKNVDVAIGTLDILLATSHDGGTTFEITNISNTPDNSWDPRITIYENNIYVVWNEKINSNDEIFFASSTDGGKSFTKPVNLSRTDSSSKDAGIKALGNNVYVIWQEDMGDSSDIFFAKSENNGESFSNPIKISNDEASELTRDTQMEAFENHVFIVWFDKSENSGVFFVKSDDYGATFSEPISLSGKVPNPMMAQITGFADSLYVIWQDCRFGNCDVFLRKSNDLGESFGSIINLSNDDSESSLSVLGPQIAVNENNVYTVIEKSKENGSDLVLSIIKHGQSYPGPVALETINGAVNVEIKVDTQILEPKSPQNMTLKFLDPVTNNPLENVNYTFSIENAGGNAIISEQNKLAQFGNDTISATFPKPGQYAVIINVNSIGKDNTFDSKYGMANAVVTVIPEFPFGVIGVMIFAIIGIIIFNKFKVIDSWKKIPNK